MRVLFYIIIAIIFILYIGDTNISFKPLSIKVRHWDMILSFIFMIVGVLIAANHLYQQGVKDTIKELNEQVDDINEIKSKYNQKV